MELKRNKKAITLVELIIALTMVSVLMVMMFGVIFKKTKAMVLSPTGTFYCWKDWDNKLHQRIIYSSGSRVVTESKDDIQNCELNFPKYVTKDANSIKAHIIGGGASGDYYEISKDSNGNPNGFIQSNINPDVSAKLADEANCYQSNTKSYCIKYNKTSFGYDSFGEGNSPRISNVLENINNRIIQQCYVQLCKSDDEICNTWYKVDNPSSYYYNNGTKNGESCPFPGDEFGNSRIKALINISNGNIEVPRKSNYDKIEYQAYSQIKFKVRSASKETNMFKTIDIADKIDRNTILKISKDDIGNGGQYQNNGDSAFYNGSGGKTVLRAKFQGEEIDSAPGVEFNNTSSKKRDLNINIKDSNVRNTIKEGKYLYASSCCNGNISECKFNEINTGIAQLVGLKNPEVPKIVKNCSDNNNTYTLNTSSNSIGFGLFGYNGFPNELIYKYKPFSKIKIYDSEVPLQVYGPTFQSEKQLHPGMGGAIIIQWN